MKKMRDDDFDRAFRTRNVWREKLIGAARFLSPSILEQVYYIMFYSCLASRTALLLSASSRVMSGAGMGRDK